MNTRFQLSTDGGSTYPITLDPCEVPKDLLKWRFDSSSGRATHRVELGGSLGFGGQQRKTDWNTLYDLESSHGECEALYIRLQIKCDGDWEDLWLGEFSIAVGKWNLDGCKVNFTPKPYDRFTCFLREYGVRQNILQVEPVDCASSAIPSLEFGTCTTVVATPVPPEGCDEFHGVGNGGPISGIYVDGWDTATTAQAAPGPSQVNFYWRERVETECVGGNPVEPSGSGWTLLEDNCSTDGTAIYVRQPIISWPFDPPQAGTVVDGENVPPDDTCRWVYMGMGGVDDPFTPDPEPVPYYVCIDSATQTSLNRARVLEDVMNFLCTSLGCGIKGVKSDFFEWNPPGDAPGYVAGINYVTGQANQVSEITILQKSDAKDPSASDPATIGELSLREALSMLWTMFRVQWDIDPANYLRIEHYSYWRNANGLDSTAVESAEALIYSGDQYEVPKIERGVWMEARDRDFVGKDIVYSGPCVTQEKDAEQVHSPGDITTDISLVLNEPDLIDPLGFVLLACFDDGSQYNVIIEYGAITGNYVSNAPLSWANLMRDFWTYDRYLWTARMNGEQTVFDGTIPRYSQDEEVMVKCQGCDILDFDADKLVKTRLGDLWGVRAHLEEAKLDRFGHLRLKLKYTRPYSS